MKVLVVEDSANRPGSLAAGLRDIGYVVDAATDSADAIAGAASDAYEVMILDLASPREASLLVLHEIRERNADVEILLLSEQGQVHDRVTALIQGADDYLVKPFSIIDLHARIQELAGRRTGALQAIGGGASGLAGGDHVDRLIASLLDNCGCADGPIELVISEVRLASLLARVTAELRKKLPGNANRVSYPAGRLPTLLVDAGLIRHLLVMLMVYCAARCAAGSAIEIEVATRREYCDLTIVIRPGQPMPAATATTFFRGGARRDPDGGPDRAAAGLSLAAIYAERMNLELRLQAETDDRFVIRLSDIRTI